MSNAKKRTADQTAALDCVAAGERKFGVAVFGWAMRKHLSIMAARKAANKKIAKMRAEIARLEGRGT